MSDTVRTNDSTPSLSAYPPAFVSLITTFIQQAEDAEMRAHKALVILKAKDQQVFQLQERMDVLEKIASRLEEVIVPPLELPQSSPSTNGEESPHPRENLPLETIFQRQTPIKDQRFLGNIQEGHNCYVRCQHLIDGLERSNSQLREALTSESTQRVRDHEHYVATLAQVTQVVKHWQQKKVSPEQEIVQVGLLQTNNHKNTGAGDTSLDNIPEDDSQKINVSKMVEGNIAVIDRKDLKMSLEKAECIINSLRNRFEKSETRCLKLNKKHKPNRKFSGDFSSRSSTSSYHTPVSSIALKLRPKSKHKSSNCFYASLKSKNRKLKLKYEHMSDKFKECLKICEQLQWDVEKLTKECKKIPQNLNVIEASTQTIKTNGCLEKVQSGRTMNILQGRLDAAAKVMAKQCKHIEDLQKQLNNSLKGVEILKKRLVRAETTAVGKEVLAESSRRETELLEDKNAALTKEVTHLKTFVNKLKEDLSTQAEEKVNVEKQRDDFEQQMKNMKRAMESKLGSLSQALQDRENMSEKAAEELEAKLSSLRNQFINHVNEARERLTVANEKIHELYLGVETFLRLLLGSSRPQTPLSPASQAEAVQVASDILQLAPGQVQTILRSSCQDSYTLAKKIKELQQLVHTDVFASPLAHVLLNAVMECYNLR